MEAEEIKKLRLSLKGPSGRPMTQAEFGEKLGRVSRATVHNWENKIHRPSRLAKRQLARLGKSEGGN